MALNIEALVRAKSAKYLDSARNGTTGATDKVPRSIRLPKEVWEDVKTVSETLRTVFPDRYVTVNSTLQFLVSEGLRTLKTDNT